MKKQIFLFVSCVLFATFASATIRNVPADVATIQQAINASVNGDTVLVAPGIYFENINFRGKNIVVASKFILNNNTAYIDSTIINGTQPAFSDTASCVVISSGEDTSAVLIGFTLTGGTGTVWRDIHNSNLYREGGGILIELSSPTIKNNLIVNNIATNLSGATSAGGGGIRIGDGNPRILNNYILYNSGRYGGGIVLNYTGATIRNNVIYKNSGGEDFSGSGVWAFANGSAPKIVENNTIVENVSVADGGGVLVWSTSMTLRNNIIWGNVAPAKAQISLSSASASVTYCDVQDGWTGTGNINSPPQFRDTSHYLSSLSPCIDAGDPSASYNDREDTGNPGHALFPSQGLLRNDMGAYGGRLSLPSVYVDLHLNDPRPPDSVTAYSDYLTPTAITLHGVIHR